MTRRSQTPDCRQPLVRADSPMVGAGASIAGMAAITSLRSLDFAAAATLPTIPGFLRARRERTIRTHRGKLS